MTCNARAVSSVGTSAITLSSRVFSAWKLPRMRAGLQHRSEVKYRRKPLAADPALPHRIAAEVVELLHREQRQDLALAAPEYAFFAVPVLAYSLNHDAETISRAVASTCVDGIHRAKLIPGW